MSIPVAKPADGAPAALKLSPRAEGAGAATAAGKGQPDAAPAGLEQASPGSLEAAVREINESMSHQSVGVRFEVDADTDRLVVKVVDRESGELIRQMPSEEVLRIAKVLGKTGALVNESA